MSIARNLSDETRSHEFSFTRKMQRGMRSLQLHSILILIFLASTAMAQPMDRHVQEQLLIDGQEVAPGSKIKLKRDDTFRMQVKGLKSNSAIDLKAKFAGITVLNELFYVDENGELDHILTFPNMKANARCIAIYHDAKGHEKKAIFKLRVK